LNILDECIKLRPYHLASKKRRALTLEKVNKDIRVVRITRRMPEIV